MNQKNFELEKYNELCYYTLSHPDHSAFIHQYVVDAFAAQQADNTTKPIKLTFALIGLYLYVEKNYTGREVQRVHILIAAKHKIWPAFKLPILKSSFTVIDVMKELEGKKREEAIRRWCESVWASYINNRLDIIKLIKAELG